MSYSRSYKSSSYKYSSKDGTEDSSYSKSALSSSMRSSRTTESDSLSSSFRRTSGLESDIYSSSTRRSNIGDSDSRSSIRRTSARSSFGEDDFPYTKSSYRDEDRRSTHSYKVDEPESRQSLTDDDFGVSLYRMTSRDDDFPSVFRRPSRDEDFPSAFRYTKDEDTSSVKKVATSEEDSYRKSSQTSSILESSRSKYGVSSYSNLSSIISGEDDEPTRAEGEIYEAILGYSPPESDKEGLLLKEGQRVEVLDSSKPRRWKVKIQDEIGDQGYVPSCYLEKLPSQNTDPKYLEAKTKREAIVKELVETEADFARDMQFVVSNYIQEAGGSTMPKELRDERDTLFNNFKAISDFHNNVLIKGVQYHSTEPSKIGKTFSRLERDFDLHTNYCKEEPKAQQILEDGPLKEYYEALSKMLHDDKSLSEHLKLPIQRVNDYQLLFQELVKYTGQMKERTSELEQALELMKSIPQRMSDMQYIDSIQGFTGNIHKMGRIVKHNWFEIIESNQPVRERYVFLFKGRMFITDQRRITTDNSAYIVKNIVKLNGAEISEGDQNKIEIRTPQTSFPLILKASTSVQKDEWIQELKAPQTYEDLGDDEPQLAPEELEPKDTVAPSDTTEAVYENLDDLETYEEMNTAITESLRSGSITSLEDFQSALEDETSLCITATDIEGTAAPPAFIKPLQSVNCKAGNTAILECEVTGNPAPYVVWKKNKKVIDVSEHFEIYDEGDKHQLLVKNLNNKDVGTYKVEAANRYGTISSQAELDIADELPQTSKPVFKEKLRDATLDKGATIKFNICVEGNPRPVVTFYHDDQQIEGKDPKVQVTEVGPNVYILELSDIDVIMAGTYSAVALNSEGQDITSGNFSIPISKAREDLPSLKIPELKENDLNWDADIDGPDFKSNSKRFKVALNDDDDSVSLIFRNVTPDGSGLYTCVACTSGSKISCSAELTVQGAIHKDPEAPKVIKPLEDAEVSQGSTLMLEFKATGHPRPTVQWFKDDKELKTSDKYKFLHEEDEIFSLVIKNTKSDDQASYKAVVKNEVGEDETTCYLGISSPPKFKLQMKDTSVMTDEPVKFEVDVEGLPAPEIKWLKDGEVLEPDTHVKILSDATTHTLLIEKAKIEDSGNYACVAENTTGSQTETAKLTVTESPSFIDTLSYKEGIESEDVKFVVKTAGSPNPDVKWLKDNSVLEEDGKHIIMSQEGDGTHSLTIKHLKYSDKGNYSCQISNEFGSDSCKANLIVNGRPSFLKGLNDTEVEEGEEMELSVKFNGCPTPTVKWMINDIEIEEWENLKITSSEKSSTLRIKKTRTTDAGSYSCKATNSVGEDTTTGEMTITEKVEETSPAKMTQKLKNIEVIEGEDVELKVEYSGKPSPTVKWSKDETEITKKKEKRITIIEETEWSSLKIRKAVLEDDGDYECEVSNSSGTDSSKSKVTVKEETVEAQIVKGLEDVNVIEGKDVTLEVEYVGKPKPSAEFTKDGKKIKEGKNITIIEASSERTRLLIEEVTKEDAGEYRCKVTNEAGSDESTSRVKVLEEQEASRITQKLKNTEVIEGEDAVFTIKYSGKPSPTVKWYKDDKELAEKERVELVDNKDSESSTLRVKKATQQDKGDYKCKVINKEGEDESTAELTVKEETVASKITKKMKDTEVIEGEDATFTVKFSGKPQPSVKWAKDGNTLKMSDRVTTIEEDSETCTLVIRETTTKDKGRYSCKVANEEGEDETYATLKVNEETEAPQITKGLKDATIKEGEDVSFTIKFTGKPSPKVEWTKDDAELTIRTDRMKIIEESSDSLTLVLQRACPEDEGKYGCVVSNDAGEASSSAKLSVEQQEKQEVEEEEVVDGEKQEEVQEEIEEQTESPKITKKLKDTEVKEGEDVSLTVKFDGKPAPTVEWCKDDRTIVSDNRRSIKEQADSSTFLIKKATNEDVGQYSCKVTNEAGEDASSAKLVVKEETFAPKFSKGLKDMVVDEGEDASFTLQFSGTPAPKVTCTKDGEELKIKQEPKRGDEDNSYSLDVVLNKLKSEDEGSYTFVISNKAGEDSSSAKITIRKEEKEEEKEVKEETEAATITQKLKDVEITEGEDASFTIKFSGKPKPSVEWAKDELTLKMSNRIKTIEEASDSCTLVIQRTTQDDKGSYSCKVVNEAGEDSTSAKLKVKQQTLPATILEGLDNVTVKEGQDAKFTVKFSGKPKPQVKWTKNDAELTVKLDRMKLIEESSDSLTLVIQAVCPEDKGVYGCKVTNDSGEELSSATLTVLKEAKPKETPEAAKITQKLKDIEVTEGEDVTFIIKFSGKPKPLVEWTKNRLALKANGRVSITEASDSCTVTIRDAAREDMAQYTCRVANEIGEDSSSAKVTVNKKKVAEESVAPNILRGLSDRDVNEGEDVSFTVKFTGKPKPTVKWTKDGAELTLMRDRMIVVEEAEDSLTLVIQATTLQDKGKYGCDVSNEAGTESSTARLNVLKVVEVKELEKAAPVFKRALQNSESKEGSKNVEFEVEVEGNPNPYVKWYLDDKEAYAGASYKILSDFSHGVHKLIISNVSKESAAVVKCVAKNDCGETVTSADFVVLSSPKVIEGLKDMEVKEGDNVKLTIKYTGSPTPTFNWMKGGQKINGDGKLEHSEDTSSIVFESINANMAGLISCGLSNKCGSDSTRATLYVLVPPKFEQEMVPQEVWVGNEALFEVKVTGNPSPQITWLKDNVPIKMGTNIRTLDKDDIHKLIIPSPTVLDSGSYTCKAFNKVGEVTSAGRLSIKCPDDFEVPMFVKHLGDQTVVIGDSVRLEVMVAGKPDPSIIWLKDGLELTPRVKVNKVTNNNVHSLTLQNVRTKDTGVYSCKAYNEKGEAVDQGYLNVKEPEVPGIEGLQDKEIKLGAQATFEIKTTGLPSPTVRWLRRSKILSKSQEVSITEDDSTRTYSFTIKSFTEEDAGLYACEATNAAGTVTKDAKFLIQPEKPQFTKPLTDQDAAIGDKAHLSVEVAGFPFPQITWLKDNSPLLEGKHYQVTQDGNTFTLEIESVKPVDAATFGCVAKNVAGEASCSASLDIASTLPMLKTALPSTLSVKEGKLLRLVANVDGQPWPKISWVKDGNPVKGARSYTSKDGECILEVSDVKPGDGGQYSIIAQNPKGQVQSTCAVNIEEKLKKSKPIFVKELKPVIITPGETAEMTAKVEGNPKPIISWTKNGGSRLISDKNVQLKEGQDGTVSLIIDNAKLDAAGQYEVTASNELGKETSAAILRVKEKPTKPEFTGELQATRLQAGEPGKLVVKYSGHPPPKVTWMKDGKEIVPNNRMAFKEQAEGRMALLIDDVMPQDAGNYCVILSNEQGQARCEAPVGVLEALHSEPKKEAPKPEFIEPLPPTLLTQGIPGVLKAKVAGKPKVQWLKNGKPLCNTDHIRISQSPDGTVSLEFDKVEPDDAGRYGLAVTLGDTTAKCEAKVTTTSGPLKTSGDKPDFLKNLEPQTVAEGEPLFLQAQVAGEPNIKWLKDGEEIVPNERVLMTQAPDGTVTLKINSTVPEDAGKYVVVAYNNVGKTRSAAPVEVKGLAVPKKAPQILAGLKPATFNEGQSAKLEGVVSGEPRPLIKWMKNGEDISPSGRVIPQSDHEGGVSLVFDKVMPKDAGKYTLVAANEEGEARSSAPVTVNQPPIFTTPLAASTDGVQGFPNKLECQVSGVPSPTYKWLKNGEPFQPDGTHVVFSQQPDNKLSLLFDKCGLEDNATYSCVATNSFGSATSEGALKVSGREQPDEARSEPVFVTPLTNQNVREGEPLFFEALVSGNPKPEVAWFLDDQPILPSKNVVLSFDGKKVRLDICQANPQHSGLFEVRITSPEGDASSRARAKVTPRTPPEFIQRLSDMDMPVKDPMKLICRVRGDPEPTIDWLYNDHKIEPGLKYNVSHSGDRCILTLPWPRVQDTGDYECRATNPVGSDSTKAHIVVSETAKRGEPPMFLKRLKNCDVLEGVPAKFTACITGSPVPDVKWFKNGEQLEFSPRHHMELDTHGVLRLVIKNIEPSDLGQYRLSISNPYGSDTCTASLRLEGSTNGEIPSLHEDDKLRNAPPSPISDKPFIRKMSDSDLTLGWRPYVPRFPRQPVTYEVDMCKLPDSAWTRYKSGLKDSTCNVKDLEPGNDYRFRVRVENPFGTSDPSPYVTAHRSKFVPPSYGDHKPKDYEIDHMPLEKIESPPRFLRKEEEVMYAVRGQPVRIEFWVYAHPSPTITWHFNGQQVDGNKYDFLQDRNGQVILFITRMTETEVGSYMCKAVNSLGEAQQKIKLLIAEAPVFKKRLDETTIMMRGRGKMSCRVIGVPYPKVKWFKDWHPIGESSRITITWIEPDLCILELSGAIQRDSGLYTCSASNIAGTASTSAMMAIEESDANYDIISYKRPLAIKSKNRPFEDQYDLGDELGRGTQGITYHAVDRSTGKSYAVKAMQGVGKDRDMMDSELEAMNHCSHPNVVRLWDAYDTKSSLNLVTDLCGGGELLDSIVQRPALKESDVAHYMRQVLEALNHLHDKGLGHLGLTLGDILVTQANGNSIKLADFGLATKLYPGRNFIQQYGHPEYISPEVANKKPVSLASDMWSVGIVAHILLTGNSPFLGDNDRDTLSKVQKGVFNHYYDHYVVLSDEAKDFINKLLVPDPSGRMDVGAALRHPWLKLADNPGQCDDLENMDRLRDYSKRWRNWYSNASCRRYYRRRPLDSCFTHPSRMLYPPNETYTPPGTPEPGLARTRVKPSAFDETYVQKINREPIDPRSESQYQAGPDTFLLPLRDPEFPVRIRQYLRVGALRSPTLAGHLRDKHWGGGSDVAVKERRKFLDILDEEIDDEKKGKTFDILPFRLQREVGSHAETESCTKKKVAQDKVAGSIPFFREKIRDVVIREGQDVEFKCMALGQPKPLFTWFRNDGILIESSRIEIKHSGSGTSELKLKPGKAYDMGMFKCVARNQHGIVVCRARLKLGDIPGKPDPPKVIQTSGTEMQVSWFPPKNDGNSTVVSYSLEYKQNGGEWSKVPCTICHEFYIVRNLQPSSTYQFRISAQNKFGWSESSSPSELANTLDEGSLKIRVSKAVKYTQEMMDRGQEPILDDTEEIHLDYSAELTPVSLMEGEPLELYNFVSEVARGRFSLIAKSWVKCLNTNLIAKVIQKTAANEQEVLQEYETHKSLRHERLACLEMASNHPNALILIMEKLSGMDVLTYLSSHVQYNEQDVSHIITQVLNGFEYLHFRGIAYLELQPDNVVMVDPQHNHIKLVDFGSARYVPPEGIRLHWQGVKEYLAPEIVKEEEVTYSADIWSVGVLAYILLSGKAPFLGDNDQDTVSNILYVRFRFDNLYKEVTQEATRFLMQVFKRTPQKRPTIEECLENKWLLPAEFLIRKREHAIFMSRKLREFSEQFHAKKQTATPSTLLSMFGMSLTKSVSLETGDYEEL